MTPARAVVSPRDRLPAFLRAYRANNNIPYCFNSPKSLISYSPGEPPRRPETVNYNIPRRSARARTLLIYMRCIPRNSYRKLFATVAILYRRVRYNMRVRVHVPSPPPPSRFRSRTRKVRTLVLIHTRQRTCRLTDARNARNVIKCFVLRRIRLIFQTPFANPNVYVVFVFNSVIYFVDHSRVATTTFIYLFFNISL